MLKKKRVRITFFDAICLVVGRIVFWALLTVIVGCITLLLVKGVYALCLILWSFVLEHILAFTLVLAGFFVVYTIWHYIKYDIQVLDIDGHRVVLRKRIFKFLYPEPTFGFYDLMNRR